MTELTQFPDMTKRVQSEVPTEGVMGKGAPLFSQLRGLGSVVSSPSAADHILAHFELERVRFGDKKCAIFDVLQKWDFINLAHDGRNMTRKRNNSVKSRQLPRVTFAIKKILRLFSSTSQL